MSRWASSRRSCDRPRYPNRRSAARTARAAQSGRTADRGHATGADLAPGSAHPAGARGRPSRPPLPVIPDPLPVPLIPPVLVAPPVPESPGEGPLLHARRLAGPKVSKHLRASRDVMRSDLRPGGLKARGPYRGRGRGNLRQSFRSGRRESNPRRPLARRRGLRDSMI
jgi:hypothetical protein